MEFQHVDVFADETFSGISPTLFISDGSLTARQLLTITQEVRHFESAFLTATDNPHRWRARALDLSGELDFAGHPLLGAVAVLHERFGAAEPQSWLIDLPATTVPVETILSGGICRAIMDQGRPEFGQTVTGGDLSPVLQGMGLKSVDLAGVLDPTVVSTGLRYLVIPVSPGGTWPGEDIGRRLRPPHAGRRGAVRLSPRPRERGGHRGRGSPRARHVCGVRAGKPAPAPALRGARIFGITIL